MITTLGILGASLHPWPFLCSIIHSLDGTMTTLSFSRIMSNNAKASMLAVGVGREVLDVRERQDPTEAIVELA